MTTARLSADQLIGSTFSFQHWPFEQVAEALAEAGMTRAELWGIAPHLDLYHADAARIAGVGRALQANGLALHCFTPEQVLYPVNIASGDAAYRAASVAHFFRAAEICAELGGKYLFLTAGRGFESEAPEVAWSHAVESLDRIADHAAGLGLRCLLEPLQRTESNILHDAADLDRMLTELGRDDIDVVLDLVAMACAGDDVAGYFGRFGARIAHVHVVDGTPAGHLVWGDGSLPLAGYIAELALAGYRGTLSFEPFGDGSYALDPAAALGRNLAALSPWLDPRKEQA